jgi:hypothetical protein
MALAHREYKRLDHAKGSVANQRGRNDVARRSIGEAAKVVIPAIVLGPPLGGLAVMALLQVVPWVATDFSVPLPEFGKNLASALLLSIPLSYAVGAYSAILAGLALAAWVAWGGHLTWWACIAASLVYPALLAVNGWIETHGTEAAHPVMINAAVMAVASASGALLTYLLLARTSFVRRLNAPPQA